MRARTLVVLGLFAAGAASALSGGDAFADDIPGVVYNSATGTYYKRYTDSISWTQAKQAAESLGGHLATITSSAENSFIMANLGVTSDSWIGASDAASEGTWVWVTGETWSYTNWNSGEPNDSNGEDYCSIKTNGTWNDLGTSGLRPYIVEWSEDPNGPPEAPTNLRASGLTEQRVDLAWNDNSTRESGFEIERAVDGAAFVQIATRGANTTSYADSDVAVETAYDYRVRAVGSSGESDYTNVLSVVTPSPAVEDLVGTPTSSTTVELTWTDVATQETGYRVERGGGANATVFSTLVTLPADSTSYTDTTASSESTYTYRLRSLGPDGSPSSGPTAVVTTFPGPPIYVGVTTPDGPHVLVEWEDTSTTRTGFDVERRKTSPVTEWTPLASVGALIKSYEDATVTPETAYEYRVRTATPSGASNWSPEKSIVTPPNAPEDFAAEAVSTNHIRLTWTDASNYERNFSIMRATAPDGLFELLATVSKNGTSYDDLTVAQEADYIYRIAANGSDGRSAWTDTAGQVHTPAVLTVDSFIIKPSKTKGSKVKPAQLDVKGAFDIGAIPLRLEDATTIHVGDIVVDVPSLTRVRKLLRYDGEGTQLTLTPSTKSSRVAFALRLSGEAVDALDADGEVSLQYARGEFAAVGAVQLSGGRFQPSRSGHVVQPPLDVASLSVRLASGEKDRLKAKGAFDASGGAPDNAPDVKVSLGVLSFRTVPTSFVRKGDVWSFKEKAARGSRKVVLDYATGRFTISLSGIDVGTFDKGDNPVTLMVSVDGLVFEDTPVLSVNGPSMGY